MLLLLLCSSISFRHTTHRRFCLGSLSTISLYHAKYVILTLMLATPYALVRSPLLRRLCRSDSCWAMEFKVLVKISTLFLALMTPYYSLCSSQLIVRTFAFTSLLVQCAGVVCLWSFQVLVEKGNLILKLVDFYSVK